MNKNEVKDLLKIIDRCYKTELALDKDIIDDWYKVLRNYELKDISGSLDNYMKFNTNFAPKVYDLTRNIMSIESKKILENAKIKCPHCMKEIEYNDEEHIDRCLSTEFISVVARRFKNQEIDKEKYRNMPQKEFDEIHLKAVKLVIAKSNNPLEVAMWEKYLENRE